MTVNYQKQLDKLIETMQSESRRKKLLLHVCCAPCASYVLEYLIKYFDIHVFFYNPNIYPFEEYQKRLGELQKLLSLMPGCDNVELCEGEYEDSRFYTSVKGLEEQREGGIRCNNCIKMRLEETAKAAAAGGFDFFCTTLSISPHKNAVMINDSGRELSEKMKINFLPSDFKKREGYKRSIELCREYDIYRQNYCGCRFSIN